VSKEQATMDVHVNRLLMFNDDAKEEARRWYAQIDSNICHCFSLPKLRVQVQLLKANYLIARVHIFATPREQPRHTSDTPSTPTEPD
jgi:hypothetical protein